MRQKFLLFSLLLFFVGCARFATRHYTVLTSKDLVWIVPKGAKFQAIQPPQYKDLTEFVADSDLIVLYKGKYMELVRESNDKFLKRIKAERYKAVGIGSLVSLLSFLGGLFSRKRKGKKRRKSS